MGSCDLAQERGLFAQTATSKIDFQYVSSGESADLSSYWDWGGKFLELCDGILEIRESLEETHFQTGNLSEKAWFLVRHTKGWNRGHSSL